MRGKHLASRLCPTCGERASETAQEISSEPAAETLTFEEIRAYWNGQCKGRIFFTYVRCGRCGLLYCREFLGGDDLSELYQQMPDNSDGVPRATLKKTQTGYFEVLRRHAPQRGDYVEIGPDIGLFAGHAVKLNCFERFWLFEPNRRVRDQLEAIFAGTKYAIYSEVFNVARLGTSSITTGAMIHVLDHLLDPRIVLTGLRERMKKSGMIVIVTHDESSLLARVMRRRWPAYHLEHPQLFNPRSITALMESTGFRVIDMVETYNYFPLLYLLKRGLAAIGPQWGWMTPRGCELRVKLGNIITVARPMG